jgi:hypothetical protein
VARQLIVTRQPEADDLVDFVGRFQRIFQGLAQEFREARRAIRENVYLREENHQLRQALSGCVDACGRFLSPCMEDSTDPEGEDHVQARQALDRARQLLEDDRPRLYG